MRIVCLLSLVLISIVAVAQNQPTRPMPSSKELSTFEQELLANQHKFTQAFADKDVAYVNQSIAADFRGIGTNGDFYDKDELSGMAHYGVSPGDSDVPGKLVSLPSNRDDQAGVFGVVTQSLA